MYEYYVEMPPLIHGSVWSNVYPALPSKKEKKKEKKKEPMGFHSRKGKANGKQHGSGTYSKRKSAEAEANSAMFAHNHPKGEHTRNRF